MCVVSLTMRMWANSAWIGYSTSQSAPLFSHTYLIEMDSIATQYAMLRVCTVAVLPGSAPINAELGNECPYIVILQVGCQM